MQDQQVFALILAVALIVALCVWGWRLINGLIGLGFLLSGCFIAYQGFTVLSGLLIFFGIVLALVGGLFCWMTTDDDEGSGYDPMRGKRTHYDKDGKVTGYSDKD